ncbi:MAG: quinolinate synthase NadA [Chitinivibrionales bacterium]|nr:quinolinate synthase NadA [Chitinivibrionales bacterium]MBD3356357.1 quinolinate synthase NadA [Chitinivibrionales bacterium]
MSETARRIEQLKEKKDIVLLAHTYQAAEIQDIADYVGDSYGLSVKATETDASTIVFCGVRFMAETAAILNPHKRVILPEPGAGCPMADMITSEELRELKTDHPDYLVMCYVNSTAEVKALSDICCTSSNALTIVQRIPADKGIIFVPDRYLGSWIRERTGREMILWNGFCPTHYRIAPSLIEQARREYPNATALIHPEARKESRDLCDHVLSTGEMCTFVVESDAAEFIIATESGIIHTLRKKAPHKRFYPIAPDLVICPNMKKGTLESVLAAMEGTGGEVVTVPSDVADKARHALEAMLTMSAPR